MISDPVVFPFLVAFGLVAGLTPAARAVARQGGLVARPTSDRWHRKPVALLGGIPIVAGSVTSALVFGWPNYALVAVLGAGVTMAFVGLIDDVKQLKPSTKLTAQIAVACMLLAQDLQLNFTGMQILDAFLTIFWFVGITNAFNLLDNMDGLCAGVAAIAALAYCVSAASDGMPGLMSAGAAVAGGAVGFLLYNFKPASIFMGDSGSMFLGATLAALPIVTGARTPRSVVFTLVVPALVVLIPIFDTAFVTVSRKLSARAASTGGRDHTSHRLVALGFSERQAVLTLWALSAAGGVVAANLRHSDARTAIVLMALLVVGIVLLSIQLARVKVYGGEDFSLLRETRYARMLVNLAYKRRVFEVLLDLGLITLAYYTAYLLRFDRDFPSYYESFAQSLPIVIAAQLGSFFIAGVYRGVWRFFSPGDLAVHARAVALAVASSVVGLVLIYRFGTFSRSVFIIDAMALLLLLSGSRAFFRVVGELGSRQRSAERRAVVYGAGDGGTLLVRELRNNPAYKLLPTAFFDDDENLWGRKILGLNVLGGYDKLEALLINHPPDVLIISTEHLAHGRLKQVAEAAQLTGVDVMRFHFRLESLASAGAREELPG